jgi:phosphatidylglycerophosphate synthase
MKVTNPLISKWEEPFLNRLAKSVYKVIHPDVATLLAVLSSIASFVLYIFFDGDPTNYLWCNLFVIGHYIFDGIDGKIACLRKINRKNGWLIDKVSDYMCSCFFVAGFFYATTKSIVLAAFLLVLTTIIHVVYAYYYLKRNLDVKVGGTESRIVLVALNLVMWVKVTFLCRSGRYCQLF